jgi:hypothetical protein
MILLVNNIKMTEVSQALEKLPAMVIRDARMVSKSFAAFFCVSFRSSL